MLAQEINLIPSFSYASALLEFFAFSQRLEVHDEDVSWGVTSHIFGYLVSAFSSNASRRHEAGLSEMSRHVRVKVDALVDDAVEPDDCSRWKVNAYQPTFIDGLNLGWPSLQAPSLVKQKRSEKKNG